CCKYGWTCLLGCSPCGC
uniref:Mu-conotoxin PnIVA n=1 Tax=Conus pennaceus TaxID=37335 RepID=CM4A_CONPE|nr:RecName: Full=Mu-conotoxin PnIVA [Conus pennaceus]prf//2116206A mu conotoxin PnIVA [Conus pennaceus]